MESTYHACPFADEGHKGRYLYAEVCDGGPVCFAIPRRWPDGGSNKVSAMDCRLRATRIDQEPLVKRVSEAGRANKYEIMLPGDELSRRMVRVEIPSRSKEISCRMYLSAISDECHVAVAGLKHKPHLVLKNQEDGFFAVAPITDFEICPIADSDRPRVEANPDGDPKLLLFLQQSECAMLFK